jgi:hypothetical protein
MNVNEIIIGTNGTISHYFALALRAPPHHSYRLDYHRVPEQIYIPCWNRLLEAIGMALLPLPQYDLEKTLQQKRLCTLNPILYDHFVAIHIFSLFLLDWICTYIYYGDISTEEQWISKFAMFDWLINMLWNGITTCIEQAMEGMCDNSSTTKEMEKWLCVEM